MGGVVNPSFTSCFGESCSALDRTIWGCGKIYGVASFPFLSNTLPDLPDPDSCLLPAAREEECHFQHCERNDKTCLIQLAIISSDKSDKSYQSGDTEVWRGQAAELW